MWSLGRLARVARGHRSSGRFNKCDLTLGTATGLGGTATVCFVSLWALLTPRWPHATAFEPARQGRPCSTSRGASYLRTQPCQIPVSQRSLHNAPIFRLLLKVAVNGTHQCDFPNFCGQQCPTWLTASQVAAKTMCLVFVCMGVCVCCIGRQIRDVALAIPGSHSILNPARRHAAAPCKSHPN